MEKSKTLFGTAENVVADTKNNSNPSLIKGRVEKITKAQKMKQSQNKNIRSSCNNKALPSNKVVGIKPGK